MTIKLFAWLCLASLACSAQVTFRGQVSVSGQVSATVSGNTPPTPPACKIITAPLPSGKVGSAYSQAMATTGCTAPFTWTISAGSLPHLITQNGSTGALTGTPDTSGVSPFTVQLVDSSIPAQTVTQNQSISIAANSGIISNSMCGVTGGGMDATAHLPNAYLCSSESDTPRSGSVVPVSNGGSIQSAYNGASCGADIQLVAGGTYTASSLNLAAKSCADNQWIYVRTAPSGSLPAEGTATCPQYSGVSSLADYGTLSCAPSTVSATAKINANSPITISGDHIRFENVEINNTASSAINLVSTTGNKIVLDRIWFHGSPGQDTSRAVGLDGGTNVSIVDSYATDLHCTTAVGLCSQGQAFNAQTGAGPYKISHNYISAAGEQILFGGGSNNLGTPSDIEISYNHTFRPCSWSPSGCRGVAYNGGVSGGHAYAVLNNIEFKNAQRVLVFGNVLENVWGGFSQVGATILITPKNQANGTSNLCPTCETLDITIRNNLTKYAAQSWQIGNAGNQNAAYALAGNSYSFHDNAYIHMNYTGCFSCSAYLLQISTDPNAPSSLVLHDLTFNHETHVLDNLNGNMLAAGGPTGTLQSNLTWKNSIITSGQFGIGNIGGTTQCAFSPAASTPKLAACWSPIVFRNNGIPYGQGHGGTWVSSPTPNSLILTTDQTAVGYTNLAGDNYILTAGSPFHNQGDDGKDLGADWSLLNPQIANAPF